jgi:flagellar biosynthetic protein FlhB
VRAGLTLDRASAFDTAQITVRLYEGAAAALVGFAPLFLLVALAAILAPLLVSGWLFTFQALQPDFSRLNPLNGLKRILSWHGAIELGKALLKTLVIGGVAAWVVWDERGEIVSLLAAPVEPGLVHLGGLLGRTFNRRQPSPDRGQDAPFQIWDHHRQPHDHSRCARAQGDRGRPAAQGAHPQLQREARRR